MTPLINEHGEGGWILNVSSMAGMGGVPYSGAYTASKAAVVALSESWAQELQNKRIGVSVLCPAFVKTRIYDSERNRPEKYKSDIYNSENESSFSKQTKQMVKDGIDASIVGKRVVEAINDGELYIFTHPNYREVNKARFTGIDEAFSKSEKSPFLKDIVNQKIDML
jgi:short-subunit dehydrogenase